MRLEREELNERISKLKLEVERATKSIDAAKDWIMASYAATEARKDLHELRHLEKLMKRYDEGLLEMREQEVEIHKNRKKYYNQRTKIDEEENEEQPNQSDWDEKVGDVQIELEQENIEDKYRPIQVFFCSRTHSQLAQVVREIKRTPYGKRIRCISLASRQQLCINAQVRKLPNVSVMNERCLDMAPKSKETKENSNSKCCTFRKANIMQELSATALFNMMDIEELVGEGEVLNACPYYAAREASKSAQLVMLTYQMLLHRRTRLQTGIDLRGAIVIIDEAHNLLDTIARLHSNELSLQQLLLVQQKIGAYKLRYLKRFSAASLLNINQLIFIVKRLIKMLQSNVTEENKLNSRVLRTYELTDEGDFFNINLHILLEFCEKSRLAQKLQGLNEKANISSDTKDEVSATKQLLKQIETLQKKDIKTEAGVVDKNDIKANAYDGSNKTMSSSGAFRSLISFLESLTENAEDGRIIMSIGGIGNEADSMYKYILLNPGDHFADVIREARSIIIAGGTMQPTIELTQQLFRACPTRVKEHFYGHVVPSDAVLPLVVAQGPTARRLCFNYTERNAADMITELGMIIQNVCNVVPAGIVCFLPSYEYLDTVYDHLRKNGILERISMKKHVFSETRTGTGSSVEKLLDDYSAAIKRASCGGALLFSVVGGKLSEGLNFADDLGRCVIVVGMPYPNRLSVELQERMRYLDNTLGSGAGNEYYENLCLKAVNQCIGRSVRHINDYACVLLVDERYSKEAIQAKLPQWITRSLQIPKTYGAIQALTARFFKQIKMRK
ncbi:ATP-dependent DNA helicase DDX11 isoform X2 [Eurosta solidaginis]|uniref:ATP-dependent DNA helicase DDX11 isoform X2 n=1 Tax=Eurosta solidaginis TaxID=178769 RepID=UPI00353081D2